MGPAALSGVLAPQQANRTEKVLLLAIYCAVGHADIQRADRDRGRDVPSEWVGQPRTGKTTYQPVLGLYLCTSTM
jgi:hypothetical protein